MILSSFSYTFYSDKVNFIIGFNGSGKSTLISCILNFLKYDGVIVHNLQKVVYQPEKVLLPDFIKVKDYFKIILQLDKQDNIKKIEQLLTKFNMLDVLEKDLVMLSKGMKQKVLLIQTLLRVSDAYIFDEPLSGLDVNTQQVFYEEIEALVRNDKLVIIVTHFLEQYPMKDFYLLNLNEKERYQDVQTSS